MLCSILDNCIIYNPLRPILNRDAIIFLALQNNLGNVDLSY